MTTIKNLSGEITFDSWSFQYRPIRNSIVRESIDSKNIVIIFQESFKGPAYEVSLVLVKDNRYNGYYLKNGIKVPVPEGTDRANVTCKAFYYEDTLALIGDWVEDSRIYNWIAILLITDKKSISDF